jgi:hypothetical protein
MKRASAGDPITTDAVGIYRDLTGRRPNKTQRLELQQQVTDLNLWRQALAHWQFHGWNPANLAGILDLYQRGGPQACHYCGTAKPKASPAEARSPRREPIDELIDELQQNPKEVNRGRPRRNPYYP